MSTITRRAALVCAAVLCAGGAVRPVVTSGQTDVGQVGPVPDNLRSSRLPDGTPILTDTAGMSLYTFLKDAPGQSNCNDACAVQWPPTPAAGEPPGEAWTVVTRQDGSRQWAYKGRPLYRWARDANAGDISGDGVGGGAWKVAVVDRPADVRRVHLAHVTTTYQATPMGQGLLPTAMAEATIAAAHAALAVKSRNDLNALKTHAGHVIHAVDPAIERTGPGLGFGVRRAAAGISEHVQLAARVPDPPQELLNRGPRVLASSGNTVKRAAELVAVAERIRAAASVNEADVARLDTLARQLVAGVDANNDGTVGWQTGEGGLAQVSAELEIIAGSRPH
jgi:predicted lipoprotein with Yx(FWY)xxD motif